MAKNLQLKHKFGLILLFLLPLMLAAQVQFIANKGQWEGDFSYKVPLKYGALFLEDDGLKAHLFKAADVNSLVGEEGHHHGSNAEILHHHAFKQRFIGSQKPNIVGEQKAHYYQNYFIGNDPKRWQGNVPIFNALRYQEMYDGIDILYFQEENRLKYNWIVAPNANPEEISWQYDGADSIWIANNEIIISTSVGFVLEQLPLAYTKNGVRTKNVNAQFVLNGKTLSFKLGEYNKQDTLIIDPVLVFSSFSGSLADNWGFTATYDAQGNLYGGGIVMAAGYPVTTGAFQTAHANPTAATPGAPYQVDCGITKFNAQGNSLLFSTYLGGNSQDQPHSMYVDADGNLFILGVTGSSNFPVTATAYQNTFQGGDSIYLDGYRFNGGTDIFIAKLNSAGTAMLACTYLGGTENDGLNWNMASNYSDQSRGEIFVAADNNVFVVSSTLSDNFPTLNAAQSAKAGLQDAVVVKLNNTLSSMLWGSYYGGSLDDAGYGIKVGTNAQVYICGGSKSLNLAGTAGKYHSSFQGGSQDGYIASFNQTSGALNGATYVGTNNYDQAFLLDLDKFNNVYVFGQTLGSYPVSSNVYSNPAGKQFIHKFGSNLSTSVFSTVFGRGTASIDIVPTALNVDDCLNILLSGWGGITNQGYLGGRMINLPLTADAYQKSTDESDFYFMVLGPNADSLKYATFFGGVSSKEHVDGGTSRFDKRGNIYQAVCAGCGGFSDFPTTPGAWSNTNNSAVPNDNCNLGVIKINFETSINAFAQIDTDVTMDTSCNSLTITFKNTSRNSNFYLWEFGNGTISTLKNPTVTYNQLGTYVIKLTAYDTICDIKDSVEIVVNHDQGTRPKANFTPNFTSCDVYRKVNINNFTTKANKYYWDFGDGDTSSSFNPTHSYASTGVYTITLIAVDTTCGASDTTSAQVDFTSNIPPPIVLVTPDSCFYGGINVEYRNDSSWYTYEWNFNGIIDRNKYPQYRYLSAGRYTFTLVITDTLCNAKYTFPFIEDVQRIEDRVFIPNAFTPNRDLINESFIIAGNECINNPHFKVFSSYGTIMFETNDPFNDFWNGFVNGKPVQEDVYVYVFESDDFEKRGYITVFY